MEADGARLDDVFNTVLIAATAALLLVVMGDAQWTPPSPVPSATAAAPAPAAHAAAPAPQALATAALPR